MRVFPKNWTELDVWADIEKEKLELPALFAYEREVFHRDGMLLAVVRFLERLAGEIAFGEWVRYRTAGDATYDTDLKRGMLEFGFLELECRQSGHSEIVPRTL